MRGFAASLNELGPGVICLRLSENQPSVEMNLFIQIKQQRLPHIISGLTAKIQ